MAHSYCHSRSGPRKIARFCGWAKAGIGTKQCEHREPTKRPPRPADTPPPEGNLLRPCCGLSSPPSGPAKLINFVGDSVEEYPIGGGGLLSECTNFIITHSLDHPVAFAPPPPPMEWNLALLAPLSLRAQRGNPVNKKVRRWRTISIIYYLCSIIYALLSMLYYLCSIIYALKKRGERPVFYILSS